MCAYVCAQVGFFWLAVDVDMDQPAAGLVHSLFVTTLAGAHTSSADADSFDLLRGGRAGAKRLSSLPPVAGLMRCQRVLNAHTRCQAEGR